MYQSRAFHQLYDHYVWCVKYRDPLLDKKWRTLLFKHIKTFAFDEHQIQVDFINGVEDHVHALVCLHPTQSVANAIKVIKGFSSRWVNENSFTEGSFSWQSGYGAFTVAKKDLKLVRDYIRNQEAHHQTESLDSELSALGINPDQFLNEKNKRQP